MTNALLIHEKFTAKVQNERASTHDVLIGIIELIETKAYLELGYPSLFEYLTEGQKYSNGSAQRRISSAELLREMPEIESNVQEGDLTLSQLANLSSAIKQEQRRTGEKVSRAQKKEILAKILSKNGYETSKVLNEDLNYTPEPKEQVIPRDETVFLGIKLTKEQFEKLKKAQAMLSHTHFDGTYADIIEELCDKFIIQKEGSEKAKAKRREAKKSTSTVEVESKIKTHTTPLEKSKYRPYISVEVDHVIPLARGGSNGPENLRILCRAHNLSEARRWGLIH